MQIFATAKSLKTCLLLLLLMVGPTLVNAQSNSPEDNERGPAIQVSISPRLSPIRAADLDKWMSSRRIFLFSAFSGIVGFLVSAFYLTKIPFGPLMNAEPRARRIFGVLLVTIVLPVVLLALFADMYFISFPEKEIFAMVANLFGMQGMLIVLTSLLSFSFFSGLTAFVKRYSHCPYLMLPKRAARS